MLNERTIKLGRGPQVRVIQGGRGSPLVWLHGLKTASADDPLLTALAEHHTVYAPVFPGQASLEELDDLPTIHDLALFYDGVLDALGLDRFVLAGHSFGAMLAGEVAAVSPGRVERLVLAAPIGLWNDAHPVEDLFARPYPAVDELIWRGAAKGQIRAASMQEGVEGYIALANGLGSLAKYTWPIPDKGLRGRLYRIEAPTLLVFADQDALVPPAYARDFSSELKRSTVRRIPGSHMAPYEDPRAFADLIAAVPA